MNVAIAAREEGVSHALRRHADTPRSGGRVRLSFRKCRGFKSPKVSVVSSSFCFLMGKKHRKNLGRPSELLCDQLERQARDDLAAGRFRKARDMYKILCKQDREKYLPLLIDANRRLAEQLMEKGLTSEAQQVLAYLRTIASASTMIAQDLSLGLKHQDWQAALDMAMRLWTDRTGALDERDRAAVADAFVLAFLSPSEISALPFSEASELEAIVGALRCLCEEQWGQAQELLRPVPRGSLFAGWKILIKAMIAFYQGDLKRAETLFSQLPPYGVPICAARTLLLFLGADQARKLDEPTREQVVGSACSFLGATNLAPFLTRADRFWQAGRNGDSYKEIRQAPGFPSEQPDLAGALSDFYFKANFAMRNTASERYLDWFRRLAESANFKSDAEARLTFRLLGCSALDNPDSGEVEHFWRKFLEFRPEDDPLNGKVASLVLEQVGNYYAQREEPDLFLFEEESDRLCDAQGAILLLEESIEHDPSNLGAYLKLLEVYEFEEKHSDRRRLLDRMARLFPKEKAVLLQAGRESVERKAYSNGIQYLECAHSLDPLDPHVSQLLVTAYTKLARLHYEKRKVNKGRHSFELAQRHAIRERTDFVRGLDFLQALQGVLEMTLGDTGKGSRLIAAARESTRSLAALLFFAHGYSRLYPHKGRGVFWEELRQNRRQIATAQDRKEIYLVFEYVRSLDEDLDWSAESEFVRSCLAPLSDAAFNREEALYFVPLLSTYPRLGSLAKSILSEALRRYPDDSRFRLYSVFARSRTPADLDIVEVEKICDDAMRRGDTKTAELARSAIKTAEQALELADEEEDDFGFPHEELEEMRRAALEMSDAEFDKFRKESSKIIPLPLFDLFMAGVRKKSWAPESERRRRTGKQTDQLDFL